MGIDCKPCGKLKSFMVKYLGLNQDQPKKHKNVKREQEAEDKFAKKHKK